jgi:hypothetical protein
MDDVSGIYWNLFNDILILKINFIKNISPTTCSTATKINLSFMEVKKSSRKNKKEMEITRVFN